MRWFRRRERESELDEEIRFHLEKEIEKNLARGLSSAAARREAMLAFGGVEKTKEEVRDVSWRTLLESVARDIRYGLRSLAKNRAFSIAAVATLALGIGANTAIFSVVHGVLLQSLPYGGGDRLVRLRQDAPAAGAEDAGFSPLELADYRAAVKSFDGLVEYHSMYFVLLGRAEPERVQTGVVSADFFDVLGVQPLLGRTFRAGEDAHGAEAVLVLSYAYWMRSFGGDPSVVGRVFEMNDRPHTVVGVLPPIPGYPEENDVYMPVSACPFRSAASTENNRRARMTNVFGRLKPGVSIAAARAELAAISKRESASYPEAYPPSGFVASPVSLREELTRQARPTFLILLGTVGLILLLACANVANLSLARLIRREREMAVRTALGADRRRLARQLLTETTMLGLAGGALGLLLARGGMRLLVSFATRFTPRAAEIHLDAPVLIFTLVVSLATGIALGLMPALSRRTDVATALHDGGDRATEGSGRHRLRGMLIVSQVAISFVLLIAAGLMLRTIWNLQRVDPGFRSERVLTSRVDLNFTRYDKPEKIAAFQEELLRRMRTEPGIASVAVAATLPLADTGTGGPTLFEIEGRPVAAQDLRPRADAQQVSDDYFRTLGVPLLRGRVFGTAERLDGPQAAVINRSLASHFWPAGDPIGARLSFDGGKHWASVVGIVGDVKQRDLASLPGDQIYVSMRQFPARASTVFVRTVSDPMSVGRTVRETVHGIDPEQPVDHFRTLEDVRSASFASSRLTAILLALFAGLALLITATGIAGVLAFSVSQRAHEFGIRMALGANGGDVVRMVVRQGMRLVVAGLAIGLAGSLALTRLLAGLLYGVRPTDPLTFLGAALLLASVASLACFLPARKATQADPMVTLRSA